MKVLHSIFYVRIGATTQCFLAATPFSDVFCLSFAYLQPSVDYELCMTDMKKKRAQPYSWN